MVAAEYWVKVSSNPLPAPWLTLLIVNPNGTVDPGDWKTTCGLSADTPNDTAGPKSLTTRIWALRVQLKPTTYCASIVSGTFSCRALMPTRFCVNKLQAWPAS